MKKNKMKRKRREKNAKKRLRQAHPKAMGQPEQVAEVPSQAAEVTPPEAKVSTGKKKSTVSEKQLRANRENSKKSTGARTPEGKLRSSKNRLEHGLTGEFCVLDWESQAEYDEHELMMLDELDPVGYREHRLAIRIAQNEWRLQRAEKIETNKIDGTHNLDDMVRRMCNVALYELRIRRQLKHDNAMLDALQAKRTKGQSQVIVLDSAIFMEPYYARKADANNQGSGPYVPAHIPVNAEEGIRYREHQYDIEKSLLDIPCRHQQARPEDTGGSDSLAS